ncbi:MAG: pirin family protein, partial [Flavobacteriales bacterium]|nr:pirin family protein [Flavobacteriales bacterium]
KNDQGVWIHQNAWFHIGEYILKSKEEYVLRSKENGIYFFVIEGEVNINDQELSKRDGMGIWDIDQISFEAKANSKILLMEVPLTIN